MARHAVPVRDVGHDLTLACSCRPELAYTVVAGSRVPVVRHRRWQETARTATEARRQPPQPAGEAGEQP
jgi:hypothetical protein